MSDANINKGYNNFVIALLLLFPVVINSVKIIGNLILLILVICGIYIFIKEKKSPFKVSELRLFSLITMGYFLIMLLSVVQNEGFIGDLYHLGRKAHFALAPFIALAIYRVNLPLNRLLLHIKIGLIIIGIIVIYQYTSGIDRPSGMYNSNIFGDLVLIMIFFSVVNFFEENVFDKTLTLISSLLGIYAVTLSLSRGSVLMLVVMSFIYFLILYRRYLSGYAKSKLIIITTTVIFSVLVFLSTQGNIKSEFKKTYDNILIWSEDNENHEYEYSSSALRLEMWSGSIEAFKESPWLGHGYRSANTAVSKYVDKEAQRIVSIFTHLHNEYITNLVSAGVIGLVALLFLLFLPLRIFLKHFMHDSSSIFSAMGILLCTSYAGIGMTHIAFGEEHVNAFYIFFLAILLPKVIKERNYSS